MLVGERSGFNFHVRVVSEQGADSFELSSPGFCGGCLVWFLPACAGGLACGWGACLGVECRHFRGRCGVCMLMLESGAGGGLVNCAWAVWTSPSLIWAQGPLLRMSSAFVQGELRAQVRALSQELPVEVREATAFSCAQAAA